MHQIMGAFGNIPNIRWHCQWWNELFILGQLVEMAVTIVLCLLQKWLPRYRLFQTLTHPWFWYILSRETAPPPESMLYWATLLICVSHPSDMLKWGEKKFSNHGRIILIHEGHEPNLWTKWALLSCSVFLLGEI